MNSIFISNLFSVGLFISKIFCGDNIIECNHNYNNNNNVIYIAMLWVVHWEDSVVASASFLGGGSIGRKFKGGEWKKNWQVLPFLCWNHQIWFDINTSVITWGGGQENILGVNAPCLPPVAWLLGGLESISVHFCFNTQWFKFSVPSTFVCEIFIEGFKILHRLALLSK